MLGVGLDVSEGIHKKHHRISLAGGHVGVRPGKAESPGDVDAVGGRHVRLPPGTSGARFGPHRPDSLRGTTHLPAPRPAGPVKPGIPWRIVRDVQRTEVHGADALTHGTGSRSRRCRPSTAMRSLLSCSHDSARCMSRGRTDAGDASENLPVETEQPAQSCRRHFVGCEFIQGAKEQTVIRTVTSAAIPENLVADGVRVVALEEFATTWAVQRPRFAWLLGAGASASAGVPLASSIRDQLLVDRYAAVHKLVRQDLDETDPALLERVHTFFDDANDMPPLGSPSDYSAAFDLCLPEPAARKALLQQLIDGARPGFAQRVFGGLIVAGACDLVITTNFDRLAEKSFAEAQRAGTDLNTDLSRELNVAGLDSTARATTALQNREWPLVLNLHGDFREKRLMNTDTELREQDATLRQFVVDASRQFGLVVSGYSGRDESVMTMLDEAANVPGGWPHGIWWLTRPGEEPAAAVQEFLRSAATNNVSATVVVAPSFDETMTALSRQVVVDGAMREYLNRLHPKPKVSPAALPTTTRKWPVLRFNALPIFEASVTVTRVQIPSEWRRGDVRRAFLPRSEWPIVVNGPGEVLCLGDPAAALACLRADPTLASQGEPGAASEVALDLLADHAPFHYQTLMLQLLGRAVAESTPVRMRTTGNGAPELIIEGPHEGEPQQFTTIRTKLNHAYGGPLIRVPRTEVRQDPAGSRPTLGRDGRALVSTAKPAGTG